MHKKAFWTVALAILAVAVVVHIPGAETVYSQGGRPQVTPEQLEKRRAIEKRTTVNRDRRAQAHDPDARRRQNRHRRLPS